MEPSQLVGHVHPFPGSPDERSTPPTGPQAIHLRLTEDVLQRLMAIAAAREGNLKIDLGDKPALLVQGDPFPLTLDPEGPHHQVARRVGGQAPGWQPLAHISHKARLKPTPASLQKAGLGLRGNYQQTEHERAERRTQVLDGPGKFAPSRTASPAPAHALAGAGGEGRNGSKQREPSRLSAVPPKPTTSFRLGRGTLPPKMEKGASNEGAEDKAEPTAEDGQPVASTSTTTTSQPRGGSPIRKTSSTSSEGSSTGGSESHTSKSTARTSLSSAGSPPGVTVSLVADGAQVKARGGVIKGKETLKKEARAASKVATSSKPSLSTAQSPPQVKKSRGTKSPSPPPANKLKSSASSTSLGKKPSQSSVQSDREADSDPSGKKRRKLLNGVAEDPKSRKGSASPARAPTPISSPRPEPRGGKSVKEGSKKRPKPERCFTSSDDDEDAEGEEDDSLPTRPSEGADKRRRTNSHEHSPKSADADRGRHSLRLPSHLASASPRMTGSPLRASSTLPPSYEIPLSIIRITSRKEYDNLAVQFGQGFKAYAKLHAALEEEREKLERGEEGSFTQAETERLVRRLETSRTKLEGDKAALAEWVKREKEKLKG